MEKIINCLAQNIPSCKCYKTLKYCIDSDNLSQLNYDDHVNITVKAQGETVRYNNTICMKDRISTLKRLNNEPLFKYFLDGSRKTYKVDDIALSKRLYPIIAGQIGVGCCERVFPDSFKKAEFEQQLVISIPECSDSNNNGEPFYNNLLSKINNDEILLSKDISFAKILPYEDRILRQDDNYENKGIACIQDQMIKIEKIIVKYLVENNRLNDGSYLIKDGSLEYSKMGLHNDQEFKLSQIKSNYQHVVGVSKSFNPELCVDRKGKPNAAIIADLPLYHRTPAFMYEPNTTDGVKFSIWYLRIRDVNKTISPFDGVLKIEKILITEDELNKGLDSDEVDLISANICNERNPVAYGSDKRWANHLYPVFLTENFIKSKYLSDIFFLNLF